MHTPFLSISLALPGHGAAMASVQIAGKLARNRTVKAGEIIEGSVLIKNGGAAPANLRICKADFENFASEEAASENGAPTEGAGWLSIVPNEFFMGADETVRLHYSCRVPSAENIKGTYWGLAMIEPVEMSKQSSPLPASSDSGLSLDARAVVEAA